MAAESSALLGQAAGRTRNAASRAHWGPPQSSNNTNTALWGKAGQPAGFSNDSSSNSGTGADASSAEGDLGTDTEWPPTLQGETPLQQKENHFWHIAVLRHIGDGFHSNPQDVLGVQYADIFTGKVRVGANVVGGTGAWAELGWAPSS